VPSRHRPVLPPTGRKLPRSSIRIDFTRLSIISPFFDLFARSGRLRDSFGNKHRSAIRYRDAAALLTRWRGVLISTTLAGVNNTSPLPIKSLGRKYRYLPATRNSDGKCPSPESATDCHQDGLFRGCALVCVSVLRHGSRDAEFLHFGDQRGPF